MNFLELAVRVHEEAGLSGSGPTSVVSQTGMAKKVVNWTKAAWNEIEGKFEDWKWLWRDDGLVTSVSSQRKYDISSLTPSKLVKNTFKIRTAGNAASETDMTWLEYEEFNGYLVGTVQTGRPEYVTQDPAGNLQLHPVPDSNNYEIRFEYYIVPTPLAANGDVPAMPEKYHEAIVYGALKRYCAHDENTALLQYATAEHKRWMVAILNEQRPQVLLGDPLA